MVRDVVYDLSADIYLLGNRAPNWLAYCPREISWKKLISWLMAQPL